MKTEMKWILLENERPAFDTDVLCCMKNGTMLVAQMRHPNDWDCRWWTSNTDEEFVSDMYGIPVYWMPLPEPPVKEDRDYE